MTLLQNKNNVLPLSKSIRKIAVIGPNADDKPMLWGNYNGTPNQTSIIMGSRKVNTEGIDEELLIATIGRRKQDGTLYRAQEPPVPAPEEESVPETEPPPTASPSREKVQKDIARRKRQEDDYSGLFLRRNEIKTR